MTGESAISPSSGGTISSSAAADDAARKKLKQERQAAALRDNLHRRKAQRRGRAQGAPTSADAPDVACDAQA